MHWESYERKLAAILYTDVAGYSRLTGTDEVGTHRRLSEYLDLIADQIGQHNGRVVHYAGDAVLADFDMVTSAINCAASVQEALATRNEDLPDDRKVQFRIGVNLGEVIVDRDDIFGDGVNIAARLESLADPGGICISESVRAALGGKLPYTYEFMGEQRVKNISTPIRAYRVLSAESHAEEKSMLPPAEKPSIAVMPFENLSGDPEQEYFVDGVTEEIITALSRIRWFFVIARQSTL
jgi:adenylate cyclase